MKVLNAGVSLRAVTDRQICEVFAGKIANGNELGCPDPPVTPSTRPDTDVDAELVLATTGGLHAVKMIEHIHVMMHSGEMAQALTATAGAIGMMTITAGGPRHGPLTPMTLKGMVPIAEQVQRKNDPGTRASFGGTKAQPSPAVAQGPVLTHSPDLVRVLRATRPIRGT